MEKEKLNPKVVMEAMYYKPLMGIQYYLQELGFSLAKVGLPSPKNTVEVELNETFFYTGIKEESELEAEYETLNADQRTIYNTIINRAGNTEGKFYFIDAPGGTGKTYLLNAIIDKLSSTGKK